MPDVVQINVAPAAGNLDPISLGQKGADIITNNSDYTNGKWCAVMALTDTVFANLGNASISLNGAAPATLTALSLGAGKFLYGRFDRINLTSGSVIAYRF